MSKATYKITLEGELLEQFLLDLEESERSAPQQIRYYLKQIYKGNLSPNNHQTSVNMVYMGHEVPPAGNSIPLNNNTDIEDQKNNVPQKGSEGNIKCNKDTLADIGNLMGDF